MIRQWIARLFLRSRCAMAPRVLVDSLESRTLLAAPSSPTSLSVNLASSNTQVQLKWSDKSNNESGFEIFRGTSSNNLSRIAKVGKNNTSYKDSSPSKGKTNYYKVRAYNSSGNSKSAAKSIKVPSSGGSSGSSSSKSGGSSSKAPASPTSFSAKAVSGSEIQLKWSDKSNNESGFEIFRGTSSNNLSRIGSVGANVTKFNDSGLSTKKKYYYKVRSYNSAGKSLSAATSTTTLSSGGSSSGSGNSGGSSSGNSSKAPAAPTSLSATALSGSEVRLKWSDKSNNESGFEIFRGTSSNNLSRITLVNSNVTSYEDSGLSKNKTYYYKVRAVNSAGKSISAADSVKTLSSGGNDTGGNSGGSSGGSSTASGVKVINIGSGRSVKNLNSATWPKKGDKPVRFVLDPGTYSVGLHFIEGNLTIESADANRPATIKLPSAWNSKGEAQNGTLSVKGSLTIRNIKTTGGENAILLGSFEGANIVAENIQMDGGALWRGSGANSVYFKNNKIYGRPRGNVYSSYGGRVKTAVIDHSGTNVPVQQGGKKVNGNPVGEAAIRIMNVDNLTLKGIITKPWYYESGKVWKQDVQLRPSSKNIKVIDCKFYQPDVGDMVWRKPAQPIEKVEFINCTFNKSPNVTSGVKKIVFSNTKINGSTWNKTVSY